MAWDISIERGGDYQPVAMYFAWRPDMPKPLKVKRGDRVLAFAWWEWQPVGDVGDNSCFYHPATVLHVYLNDGEVVADLYFDSGRRSDAHFVTGLRPIDAAPAAALEHKEG